MSDAGAEGPRLQKVLAQVGIGSRRVCEELIADGRITVNGDVAELGRRVDPLSDRIAVDGVPLSTRPGLVYYLLNKPAGVVSTAADPQGRPTVVGLLPAEPRVHPVGRLDFDTEGLLILTNDGDLTFHLTHPKFGVEKEYLVSVRGRFRPAEVRQLREGVTLDDGITAPARVALIQPDLLKIVIHEGRNRQVRRMCAAVGHPVERLVRVRIGPLADRSLGPGEWRPLAFAEIRALASAAHAADTASSSEIPGEVTPPSDSVAGLDGSAPKLDSADGVDGRAPESDTAEGLDGPAAVWDSVTGPLGEASPPAGVEGPGAVRPDR